MGGVIMDGESTKSGQQQQWDQLQEYLKKNVPNKNEQIQLEKDFFVYLAKELTSEKQIELTNQFG